jgi:hypothetical protein
MAEPLIPVNTIKYTSYLKRTFVEALRSVFAAHPDPLLARTKVGIDFPMEQADYPAIVIRWYERNIDNAGVAHAEWLEVFDTIVRQSQWNDLFTTDTQLSYFIFQGTYPTNGAFDSTNTVMQPTAIHLADRVESNVRLKWRGDAVTIDQHIKTSDYNGTGFFGRVTLNNDPGKMDLEIYFREGPNNDKLRQTVKVNTPVRGQTGEMDLWLVMQAIDDHLTLGVWTVNPSTGSAPHTVIGYKVSGDELVATTSFDQVWLRFVSQNVINSTIIETYSVNSLNATFAHAFRKFRHLIYTGDLEFAVYALSSKDRDLIRDSLIEILQMADLEPWTNQLLTRLYYPDPVIKPDSQFHFINLNTDRLSGFGETQSPVPWEAEDQLIYNVSYRMGVLGELYSRVPPNPIYGMVEAVDVYPYMGDVGEPKPNPHPDDATPWV